MKVVVSPILGVFLFLVFCGPVSGQTLLQDKSQPGEEILSLVDSSTIRQHLATLADDRMEGRAPGTTGERLAVEYIASEMKKAGLEPAGEQGGYFQSVPLRVAFTQAQGPLILQKDTGESIELTYLEDFVANTDLDVQQITTTGDLVFAGFGIDAPDFDWNDYTGADVQGKILVVFVNEPPAPASEPNLFRGDTLTYYGRWTYKLEEARRQGARGVILIHTPETAGYAFSVLQNSMGIAEIQLQDVPENALEMRGWITEEAAEELARLTGSTLDEWYQQASDRSFKPIPLPWTLSYDVVYDTRRITGTNVIGIIRGSERPEEAVVYTAHHDHLGVGPPDSTGDAIYNGALDNASGVAMLLAAARAFGSAPPPERSVIFVSVTAEESGLLGAEYYVRYPAVSMEKTIANINLDSGNVFGRAENIVGNGAERSEIITYFTAAAAEEGMSVLPNSNPGGFYRSDQLAFARVGVPAVYINTGNRFVGQPEDYWTNASRAYGKHYHQPSDEFDPSWPMEGLVQQARVGFRMGYQIVNSDDYLQWNPGEAFGNVAR